MSHETARQRAARLKRDPYRGAQIAPRVIAPTRCATCGHADLMHERHISVGGECLSYGCECTAYQEA